jgi:hypothetical protein
MDPREIGDVTDKLRNVSVNDENEDTDSMDRN